MAMWDESRVIWDFKDVERRNQYQGEVQHVVLIFFLLLLSSTALVPSSVSVSFLFFFFFFFTSSFGVASVCPSFL